MSDLRQSEVEVLTLQALYDLANQGGSWVDAAFIAGTLQQGVTVPRAKMALRTLESGLLVRGRHNVNSGSKYEITDKGYKRVESELEKQDAAGADEAKLDAPAADRVVGFDHNSKSYREAREKVGDLEQQLIQANDHGDMTRRSAAVAAEEVSAIGRTLDEEYFRPYELWVRAKMTLSWIGREAAGAVVGAAALGLLALLASLLGFPIV